MLRIRFKRVGKKGQPSYRIVVADARSPRDGKVVAYLGHYNPRTDPPTAVYDEEKTLGWLRQGAQPSDPMVRILRSRGTMEKVKLA